MNNTTIQITLNREIIEIENEKNNLLEILRAHDYCQEYIAIAINRVFVPKHLHATIFLQAGDVIDIISPMQGG